MNSLVKSSTRDLVREKKLSRFDETSPPPFFQDADKLDYESRQERNATDVCQCQQQRESNFIFSVKKQKMRCKIPREPEERTDSCKSEEEAATTIQAVYRGYKARKRFDEVSGYIRKLLDFYCCENVIDSLISSIYLIG